MSKETEASELFRRYLDNNCTSGEITRLMAHFELSGNEMLLRSRIRETLEKAREVQLPETIKPLAEETFARVQQHIQSGRHRIRRSRLIRFASAAAIILVAGITTWLFYGKNFKKTTGEEGYQAQTATAIPEPGGDKAILTLANGRTIILDTVSNGSLGQQGSNRIVKVDGQISFSAAQQTEGERLSSVAPLFNTIRTPRGGQYRVLLPDGSQVWLNAASSLRFPVSFAGGERNIEITGEAYLEVAQDAGRPFYVKTDNLQIQVLGTSFNINAYRDEPVVKTTLLKGKIKVTRAGGQKVLSPGQQAIASNNDADGGITVRTTDTEEVIAWKNGLFVFNNADIMTIMRQVARWYNVEIVTEGPLPADKFMGEVPRSSNITEVLKILELSNIHTRIDGNKIRIIP